MKIEKYKERKRAGKKEGKNREEGNTKDKEGKRQ